jgi:hypothetical protein
MAIWLASRASDAFHCKTKGMTMGIDPRGLAQAMGDAEARLNAVRGYAEAMSAKAAGLDAVVTHQRSRIRELEAALDEAVHDWRDTKVWHTNSAIGRAARSTAKTPGHPPATPPPGGWPKAFIPVTDNNDISITPQAETGAKHE